MTLQQDDDNVMIWDLLPAQEQLVLEHNFLVAFVAGLGCVHPDTRVRTQNGLIPIKDIDKPTKVLSWCTYTKRWTLSNTFGAAKKGTAQLFKVITEHGRFIATADHGVFSDKGFVKVEDLTTDNYLGLGDTKTKVLEITDEGIGDYWDMQVHDTNNYVDEYGHIHHNSGKTRGAVYKALELGYSNQGLVGVYVMPNYSLVESTALPTFKEILELLNIPYRYNQKKYEMVIDDVFTVIFRSAEETEKIVGFNAAWGIIDEPGIMDENILKKVQARIRNPRANRRQLILVGTPEGLNWFYEFTKRKDVKVIKAKTTDNIHLPDDYVDQLKASYTDEEIEAYINGEFVRFRGGWFKNKPRRIEPLETINGLEIFRLPQQGSGQYVIGVDTGGGLMKDSSAVVLIDKRDKALVAAWCSDSAPIDEIAERVEYLYHRYSSYRDSKNSLFTGAPSAQENPVVLIETNGIGEGCYQTIAVRKRIPAVRWKTTESSRYEGMLLVKRAVESGIIEGPLRLQKESDDLMVENGRFKGPKDMSMSIGFCLKYTADYPYIKPQDKRAEVFEMRFNAQKR